MSAPPVSPRFEPRHRIWAGALLLIGIVFIAYFPSLTAGFIWDDDTFLTRNPLMRSGDGLYRFWFTTQPPDYFPVTYTPLWFEWRLWGMHAAGYHAANLALHIAGALLLWAVLRRLRMPGAYVAAFIFAVHPVNVESVAWITQRKNLMALLFFLATIWSFLKSEIAPPSPVRRSPATRDEGGSAHPSVNDCGNHPGWYVLSLLCFTLAMLSKGSVAMLPVILLGLMAWHRRLRLKDIALMLPFFFVSAVLVATDVWFQKHGSHEVFRNAGFLERLLGAGAVVWFYLLKALLPIHLLFIYPQWHIRADDPRWWVPLVAAVGLTVILWRCRRRFSRPALFAWGFFCVALVPVMGFTDVQFMQYSLVADHYEQIALIGVIGLVAAAFPERVEGLRPRLCRGELGKRIVAAGVIAILSVLTWRQCQTYRDAETLYRATLDRNPDCWLAQSNLGSILYRSGRIPEAIVHFDAALRLKPDLFEAQNDLGLALTATGRLPEAVEHFDRAIRIHADNAAVYYNAATALAGLGRLQDAIPCYERALRLRPGFAEAHQDLGAALTQQGRFPEAIRQYQEALSLRPDYFEAHANLGTVLAHLGRTEEARAQFEEALRLEPNDAATRANLARLPAVPQNRN